MTLLKSSTQAGADDSFLNLENSGDTQVDSCMCDSLTTIVAEMRTLTINSDKTEQSCDLDCSVASHDTKQRPLLLSVMNLEGKVLSVEETTKPFQESTSHPCGDDFKEASYFGRTHSGKTKVSGSVENSGNTKERKTLKNKAGSRPGHWGELSNAFPDEDGDTILHLAVLHAVSHLSRVVRLLGLQRQVNVPNRLYQTPLHLAVATGNTGAMALLLDLGASLSVQDSRGNTPLHLACQFNHSRTLKTLLQGAKKERGGGGGGGDTEAWRRRKKRQEAAALRLKNYEGLTCLHLAVHHANQHSLVVLLRHGADVNAKDGKSGRTALHLAVDRADPSPSVVSTLLLCPALHINATNFAHQTPLQLAVGRGHLDLAHVLRVRGADWSDSVPGCCSSDSLSEEDEEDSPMLCADIHRAGQRVSQLRQR